jgi:hypothetical protein
VGGEAAITPALNVSAERAKSLNFFMALALSNV